VERRRLKTAGEIEAANVVAKKQAKPESAGENGSSSAKWQRENEKYNHGNESYVKYQCNQVMKLYQRK
jgi:hypothetical protein